MQLSIDRIIGPRRVAQVGPAALRALATSVDPALAPPNGASGDDVAALAAWLRGLAPDDHAVFFERLHAMTRVLDQQDPDELLRGHGVSIPSGRTVGEVLAQVAANAPDTLHAIEAQASLVEAEGAKAFVAYHRAGPDHAIRPDHPRLARFEQVCAEHFRGQGNGAYCRVWPSSDGPRTAMVVGYGTALRTERLISANDQPELRRFRNGRDAVLLLAPDGRDLDISARWPGERSFFARAVGDVFFDDPRAFKATDKYDLEPICQLGFHDRLTSIRGPEIAEISLRELLLVARHELSARMLLKSRDVLSTAELQGIKLDQFEPRKALFKIVPRERKRRRVYSLEITGNNSRKLDAPWSESTVEELIRAIGLDRREDQ